MKIALGTALLVLLAGTSMYAQEQDKEKDKPAQQEEKKQEPAREQPKAQEQQNSQDQQKAQHQAQEQQKDQAKQDAKAKSDAAKQQQQAAKQQQQVARQDHAQNQQAQHDRGNARRIPEADFRSHFGREHTFHVTRSDDRRFSYGGYYFVYNDPWPSGWAYTDDVYVDEIDGEYYLIDPVHPGIRLLIVIVS